MKKHIGIILVLLCAIGVRLPLLTGSFWLDEAAQALESARPLSMQYKIQDDFQPPLFHYLVHFLIGVSKNEAWLRMGSFVSGILAVGFLYALLQSRVGRSKALLASLFLSVSPLAIFYSQELRPYALACFFAVLSWYALKGAKKPTGWLFVAATIGGLYSMYLYPFVLISQLLYFLVEDRKQFRTLFIWTILSGLAFLPWLPFFLGQLKAGTTLTTTLPGWASAVATPQLKALPLVIAKFLIGQLELHTSHLATLVVGLGACLFVVACIRVWRSSERWLVYWFGVPVVGSWLVSFVVPVIQPKRLLIALPAFVAILVVGWWKKRLSKPAVLALGFLFILQVGAWSHSLVTPSEQRENWRGMVRVIERDASGEPAAALFAFPDAFAPWNWYSNGSVQSLATGTLLIKSTSDIHLSLSGSAQLEKIYLFDYLRDLSDPNHALEQWLSLQGYQETKILDGGQIGFVRIYQPRYNKGINGKLTSDNRL